jgi:2-polyprenyl-3-methyl-5-hydroxy-6-metoxy-1,4-benzoquinol methylase
MNDSIKQQSPEILEKIRQQYETSPYPRKSLDESPKGSYSDLFVHNFVTPFYLKNQQIPKTDQIVILDAGCGSGWKSLMLAEANPGARIVGIDLSEESVKLAQQRLLYHGFENSEFHVLPLENLPKLGLRFDYINCDEVLYLLPDLQLGLNALRSVLNPEGIIRTNLHSKLQREGFFRAQALFEFMGLMDENPGDLEVEVVVATMRALNDQVNLKAKIWGPSFEQEATQTEFVLMNMLLQSDKGFTIPEMFSILQAANLEFLSMVAWRRWELLDLFKDPDELPALWDIGLPNLSAEERLRVFELLQPVHRLLDFWCSPAGGASELVPVTSWDTEDWLTAQVTLHPQLQVKAVKTDLLEAINRQQFFEVSRYIPLVTSAPIWLDPTTAACFLPLWDQSQPFTLLVERWMKLSPCDFNTLEPITQEAAVDKLKHVLSRLEVCLYVLIEKAT